MAISRAELDEVVARGCEMPDCDHAKHAGAFHLHPRCHPGMGLDASYRFGEGVLHLACRICKTPVADIAVSF